MGMVTLLPPLLQKHALCMATLVKPLGKQGSALGCAVRDHFRGGGTTKQNTVERKTL